ncbi:MAG: hypothetical protein SWZ49_26345 [Cyanobacteriota bacterium]|nr:hypothetical protein [Cyanobacteriota bacterium]
MLDPIETSKKQKIKYPHLVTYYGLHFSVNQYSGKQGDASFPTKTSLFPFSGGTFSKMKMATVTQ